MKPTNAISVCVLAAGLAMAQNPSVIQNTRATMNGVRDTSTAVSNAALGQQKTAQAPAKTAGPAGPAQSASAPAKAKAPTAAPVSGHPVKAKKAAKTSTAEKAKEPKAAPEAPKKVGEIVASPAPAAGDAGAAEDAAVPEKYGANGRRDPFVSPVVAHATTGSGCTTGKKCLEIGSINLRGVVRSENGFIAVVSNSLNKAYFLRENDPVFNGYVVKITGDSIVFQETLQDRLGKTFTREVTKKITVPAV
jgi:hypothetical protein